MINKKLIRFKKKVHFNTKLNAGEIPLTSIIFIEDTSQIWTNGIFYGSKKENIIEIPTKLSQFQNDLGNYGNWVTEKDTDKLYSKINHTHNYLPLSGGTLTGDLNFKLKYVDRYISWLYNGGINYSWRVGYLGTGIENENYFTIESGGNNNKWESALKIGSIDRVTIFDKVPKVGNLNVSLENHTHDGEYVTLNTNQTITGTKTFSSDIKLSKGTSINNVGGGAAIWNVNDLLWRFGIADAGSIINLRSEKVGIGTDTPTEKLEVKGNVKANNFIGNATTATMAKRLDIIDVRFMPGSSGKAFHPTPLNLPSASVTAYFGYISDTEPSWRSALTLKGWNSSYNAWQLIGGASDSDYNKWYLRSGRNDSWNTSYEIWHSGNLKLTDYIKKNEVDSYLGDKYVNTDKTQTITGLKTFTKGIKFDSNSELKITDPGNQSTLNLTGHNVQINSNDLRIQSSVVLFNFSKVAGIDILAVDRFTRDKDEYKSVQIVDVQDIFDKKLYQATINKNVVVFNNWNRGSSWPIFLNFEFVNTAFVMLANKTSSELRFEFSGNSYTARVSQNRFINLLITPTGTFIG